MRVTRTECSWDATAKLSVPPGLHDLGPDKLTPPFCFLTLLLQYEESIVIVQQLIMKFLWKYPLWDPLSSKMGFLLNVCLCLYVTPEIGETATQPISTTFEPNILSKS